MTIYDDYAVREQAIWEPFSTSFRFSTSQIAERVIIFGMYSGAYLNNITYLEYIDTFELALIVDEYNQQMAELDADEQKVILDIATKRYIQNIERQILQGNLAVERLKIEAENAEWNAKIAALASDYKTLETLQTKLEIKQKEVTE